MRQVHPDDLRGVRRLWLLVLTVGGQDLYIAEEGMSAPDLEGATVRYRAGLVAPDWTDAMELFGSGGAREVALTVHPDRADFNLPSRVHGDGVWLAGSRAVLRLWCEGTDVYPVWIDGEVHAPEYGAPSEPLDCTLREAPFEDRGLLPWLPSMRVTSSTWPSHAERVRNTWYPLPIGHAGGIFGTSSHAFATPALMVDTAEHRLLVAGTHVSLGTISILDVTTGTEQQDRALTNRTDGEGNAVATVDLDGVGAIRSASGYSTANEFHVSWWAPGANVDALQGPNGQAIRGAGDMLAWVLGFSTLRRDLSSIRALAPLLNRYPIDGAIVVQDPISPWSWIQEHLLPILPVSARVGPRGLTLIPWRSAAVPSDARAELVARCNHPNTEAWQIGNAERLSRVTETDLGAIANHIEVQYQHTPADGRYRERVLLSGDPQNVDNDARVSLHYGCRLSQARLARLDRGDRGVRPKELRTSVLWDDGAATAVAQDQARRYALPQVTVRYAIDDALGYLVPGDVVLLTDAELYWTDRIGILDEVQWSAVGHLEVTVRLLADPPREQ